MLYFVFHTVYNRHKGVFKQWVPEAQEGGLNSFEYHKA